MPLSSQDILWELRSAMSSRSQLICRMMVTSHPPQGCLVPQGPAEEEGRRHSCRPVPTALKLVSGPGLSL